MDVLKGEYIGFTYNGVHSSELGIMRVSEGSRFNENLLPTIQDKTAQIPGGDGTYYFGSYYTQRQISISFAFEGLTELQLERLREFFGDKKPHFLIFDERPYKAYYAKVTGTTVIKHIPFSEGSTNRVYKGEGTIQFTCHQPYAVCTKKFLIEYPDSIEWGNASGLLEDGIGIDVLVDKTITLYNPGVKPTSWKMYFIPTESRALGAAKISLEDKALVFGGCIVKDEDEKVVFDSKTKLIEGLRAKEVDKNGMVLSYEKSGNIYNEYIVAGDFFDIPITATREANRVYCGTKTLNFEALKNNPEFLVNQFSEIKYNYYYY